MKNVIFVLLFIGAWVTCGTSVAAESAADGSVSEDPSVELRPIYKFKPGSHYRFVNRGSAKKADPEAGKLKAEELCSTCHGPNGNSTNIAYPKLAGQYRGVLAKQISDFETEARPIPDECAALELEFQDRLNVAEYYSKQQRVAGNVKFDDRKVEEGKKIYFKRSKGTDSCASCHGGNAEGNSAAATSNMVAQPKKYLIKQMKAFKSGQRFNDWEKMMSKAIVDITDAEIKAVAEYISSLKPESK